VAAADTLGDWVCRRVLVSAALPCGECAVCQRGRGPACPQAVRPGVTGPGALASHLCVPARTLVAVTGELLPPPSLDVFRLAAVAGPAGRIYHAMARAGLGPGELAVFLGNTAEAHLGTALCRCKGAQAVMMTGAPTSPADVRARLGEAPPRVWHIFETSRTPTGAEVALGLAGAMPTGTVSFIGAAGADIPLGRAAVWEVPVLVTDAPHPDLLIELCALVTRGDLCLDETTAPITPAAIDEAVNAILQGHAAPCPILVPTAPSA
jgi:D-arabinose 1-dehydrogenase-like Zn-dependent alcohol dehydrogenase